MNEITQNIVGAAQVDLAALDGYQVPRIAIVAFCETQAAANTIAAAAADRRMTRATVDVRVGGIGRAVEFYRDSPSPDLLVVESQAANPDLLQELEALADVCDPDTKVMVIGASNDVMLYRELIDRGIADYLVGPVCQSSIIAAIARLYRGNAPRKLGKTCAFIGAKGGVGASTLAHNVAWALGSELGSNVILADLDMSFGTAGLDLNIDADQGMAEAIDDSGRLDELLLDRLLVKCNDHLSLLAAPATLGKTYDLDDAAFEPLLEIARNHAATVVLDLPHVWTAWSRRTLLSADEVVIVAEPDLANLRNAKSLVDLLIQSRPNDAPPRLVLNLVGMPRRPEINPAEFAAAVNLDPIARIAFDPGLFGAAANKGQMIADFQARSPVCAIFTEIARVIAGRGEARTSRKGSVGEKILRMFYPNGQRPKLALTQAGAGR